MMKKKVRNISVILSLALILGLMAGVTVNAGTVAPVSGAPEVVDTLENLGSTSIVYAGEITVDGRSEMTYLYSDDITNSMTIFDTLRSCLSDTAFSNLVPDAIAKPGAKGLLSVCSAHQDAMSSDWTSAAAVAEQYFTGTIGTETGGNFYDMNSSYASKVDANYAGRVKDVMHPLDFNKSIASLLKTEISSSDWVVRDGNLIRQDVLTFTIEETTVIYTAVNVTTDKSEGIGGKTQWMFEDEDTIDFNSASLSYQTYYNKVGIDPSSTMQINNGSYTVVYEGWYAPATQHNIIFKHNGGNYLHFKPNDFEAESPKKPIGIKLVSGEGTKASPYLFELVYDEPDDPEPVSATVTFKVEGGSWDDGTTADKTVTLTGSEGDTLKLAAEQVPAVGSKPGDGYKAGSWDVTPDTETAITENTTYTYTYAQKENISATVTFKVVNGSWNDGTTADKTVTLTGSEGETLKLAAADIPAVGSKPGDGYKAGSWNVTPDTETAIKEDTTYTYTYAEDKEQEEYQPYIPELISATVTFKVEGGSWDDGSAADKTVTLIGYEGDTLKLAAADIPAVGSKPDDGYKAGSWNEAPGTETAITANTTYTYSYAQKENISATVTFKVEGGSWDDGTTADKTVTLTGYEGDTLKLEAADIPAVGSRPNDGYKAGSWNAAPGTETAIAADTTYTYSYAEDKEPEDKEPEDKEPEDDEISYINTEGTGETWTKESSTGLTFRFSRSVDDKETFSHFTGVLVDGKEVDPSNYTAKAGSVIIDLKPAYMETLSAGEHTLTALFDDGNDVAVKFTVKAKKAEEKPAKDKSGDNTKKGGDSGKKAAPKTGESFNLPIMLAILLLAFSGIISLGIIGLKTKGKKGEPKE